MGIGGSFATPPMALVRAMWMSSAQANPPQKICPAATRVLQDAHERPGARIGPDPFGDDRHPLPDVSSVMLKADRVEASNVSRKPGAS
jgi:hypothetical protein